MKTEKKSDPKKLEDLKIKINDERYLNQAIMKIAQVLTNRLLKRD